MGRQCRFLFPFFCPVVCHGETQESGRAIQLLVAEFDWVAAAARLWITSARLRFHFCLRLYLDSLHPQFDHCPSPRQGASNLFGLWVGIASCGAILPRVRSQTRRRPEASNALLIIISWLDSLEPQSRALCSNWCSGGFCTSQESA